MVKISNKMQALRDALEANGFGWLDASEDIFIPDYHYHMERTKVIHDEHIIASCIYGYIEKLGEEIGSSYGYPEMIEAWPNSFNDPIAMTIDEIVQEVKHIAEPEERIDKSKDQ